MPSLVDTQLAPGTRPKRKVQPTDLMGDMGGLGDTSQPRQASGATPAPLPTQASPLPGPAQLPGGPGGAAPSPYSGQMMSSLMGTSMTGPTVYQAAPGPTANMQGDLPDTGQPPPGEPTQPSQPSQPSQPQGGYNREQFRDAWMSSGGRTVQDLRNFIAAHPEFATGVQLIGANQDKAQMPDGEVLDLVIGAGAGGTGAGWTGIKGTGGQPLQGGGGGGGAYQQGPMNYSQDPRIQEMINRLLERGNTPVTANDPGIRAQFDPVSAALSRGSQLTKGAAAERAAYQGTNIGGSGGALDAEMNSINENTGNQQGQLMAQFVGQEIQARRQDVVQALQFAQGEEKMQLEMQLAQMNDALQRLGLENQNRQFYDRLGYDIGRDEYDRNAGYGRDAGGN